MKPLPARIIQAETPNMLLNKWASNRLCILIYNCLGTSLWDRVWNIKNSHEGGDRSWGPKSAAWWKKPFFQPLPVTYFSHELGRPSPPWWWKKSRVIMEHSVHNHLSGIQEVLYSFFWISLNCKCQCYMVYQQLIFTQVQSLDRILWRFAHVCETEKKNNLPPHSFTVLDRVGGGGQVFKPFQKPVNNILTYSI